MPKPLATGARLFLGIIFFVFGLNGFLLFIEPPAAPEEAEAFINTLIDSGYVMTLTKSVETVCGFLLLANLYAPLALVILTPVIVNIAGFHLVMDPSPNGLTTVAVIVVLLGILTRHYWPIYRRLMVRKPSDEDLGQ